jgi:hypothetical protein
MAFTEHGAIMAATILKSQRAAQMSVYVVRAFVKLRQALASTRKQFDQVYEAIIGLMSPAAKKQ